MARLEQLPDDLVFYTQITMEAAEDTEFLDAMRRAHIRGALVGIESVTPEGLKAVYKDFNEAGDALVTRLQRFRKHGVHVLGSFIFGLPTDKPATFPLTAALAQSAGISFAQFVMLQPLPGTVDFGRWEKDPSSAVSVEGVPLSRYWLIPSNDRPKIYMPHPTHDVGSDPRGHAVDVGRVLQPAARLAALVVRQVAEGARWRSCCCRSSIGRCTRTPGSRPTAPASPDRPSAPGAIAKLARRLFVAKPMPDLKMPVGSGTPVRMTLPLAVAEVGQRRLQALGYRLTGRSICGTGSNGCDSHDVESSRCLKA